jgi:hypothetical protein
MGLGTTRIGATATQAIIEDFRARKAGVVASAAAPGSASGEGGY